MRSRLQLFSDLWNKTDNTNAWSESGTYFPPLCCITPWQIRVNRCSPSARSERHSDRPEDTNGEVRPDECTRQPIYGRWSWSMNQELVTIKSYHTTVANRSVSGIKRGDPFGVNTAARPHRLLWRVPWTGFWEAAEPCSPPAWFPGPSDLSDTP